MSRRAPAWLLLAATLPGAAQPVDPPDWIDSAPARGFRQRVIELALLYDRSSGIDPRGFRVDAARAGRDAAGCALVEVATSRDGVAARRDTVTVCPDPHPPGATAPAPAPPAPSGRTAW